MIFSQHHETAKDVDPLPALAPLSVCSAESLSSSYYLRELDSSITTQPLPEEIEAGRPRKVSFGEVTLRSYPVILGDHPDCIGPPVSSCSSRV